jgi:hypothetical protein
MTERQIIKKLKPFTFAAAATAAALTSLNVWLWRRRRRRRRRRRADIWAASRFSFFSSKSNAFLRKCGPDE